MAALTVGDSFDARQVLPGYLWRVFATALREAPPNAATVLCPVGTIDVLVRWRCIDLESLGLAHLHVEEHVGVGWVYVVDAQGVAADGHQF